MIILDKITCEYLKSVEVELPRANMVIDPRPNEPHYHPRFRCEYHENGTTVTLTHTEHDDDVNDDTFTFRVYDPATETVPSFDSKIYTYLGEDDESAPRDTTILIIHPSVTVIKEWAFSCCEEMKKCIMHDGIHTIEEGAFYGCSAMEVIRLSQSLTNIGARAFEECDSLDALFLPPTVNQIDKWAFRDCVNLRILSLPLNISLSQIGERILWGSYNFIDTIQVQEYNYDYDNEDEMFDERTHQEIIDFYRDQVPPLHKACLDTNVTRQTIQECIDIHGRATSSITDHDGMTPLHILAMNPHANISAILACFDLNMSSVIVGDGRGNTPLDYLRVHHDSIEDHTSLVSSLCVHRYAAAASRSSQDDEETSTNKKRKRSNDE